jgi:hypothetical protein
VVAVVNSISAHLGSCRAQLGRAARKFLHQVFFCLFFGLSVPETLKEAAAVPSVSSELADIFELFFKIRTKFLVILYVLTKIPKIL